MACYAVEAPCADGTCRSSMHAGEGKDEDEKLGPGEAGGENGDSEGEGEEDEGEEEAGMSAQDVIRWASGLPDQLDCHQCGAASSRVAHVLQGLDQR